MIDIKKKYQEAKKKAMQLMGAGRLTEYIAQLVMVEQLKLQMLNADISNSPRH